MATYVEELISRLSLDVNGASFSEGENRISSLTASVAKFGAIAAGIGTAIAGVAMTFVGAYAKIEDAEAAFTPLLGGADKAREAVEKLNEAAAKTPFEFNDLSKAMGQLLPVMDGDIQNTIDSIQMLGDTSMGNAQKLDSITRGYTKAMLKGKVDMESLNMIGEAGVPIVAQLADMYRVGTDELLDMVSSGEVGTADLTAAFKRMTSEGGIFFNGMAIASETFSGRMSTLRDNLSLTAAAIGKQLMPMAKALVDRAIEITDAVRGWVEANGDAIKSGFLKFLKAVKIAFAVAAIAATAFLMTQLGLAVMAIPASITALSAMLLKLYIYVSTTNLAAIATMALNAAVMLIPFLIGLAIVALALFLEDLYTWANGGESLTGKFIDKMKEILPTLDSIKQYWTQVWDSMFNFVLNKADALRNKLSSIPGYTATVDFVSRQFDRMGGNSSTATTTNNAPVVNDNRVVNVNGGNPEEVKRIVAGQSAYAARTLDTGLEY